MAEIQSAAGLVVLFALAWVISEKRRRDAWRIAAAGIGLQIVVALILLKVPVITDIVGAINGFVRALEDATKAGTSLVFGYLGGGDLPFDEPYPGAALVLAFRALPIILLVSALSALLTHWRILPWIVKAISRVLERSFRIGGAVSLASAANIFIGMVEAPLFVRPYLAKFSRGELFVLMVTGMATIAGTVFVIYASILGPVIPDAASNLLVASVVSVPAAISIALVMVPTDGAATVGVELPPRDTGSAMEAIVAGTEQGLRVLLGIVSMLVVFVALVHLVNMGLGLLPDVAGSAITLQRMLGTLLMPICWLMGIPWAECAEAGRLLATRIVLNEFIAYLDLAGLADGALSERSRLIMTYALCGFANFGSLGIMIGGLAVVVPERKADLLDLGLKSIVAGSLATCCTGCIIGILG
ncbi:MAG: nucleoside:proton symporter [Rhodospirillales bacterium]|nr:nucleoside:proton symporter [Rhodospirillales bacterium]